MYSSVGLQAVQVHNGFLQQGPWYTAYTLLDPLVAVSCYRPYYAHLVDTKAQQDDLCGTVYTSYH